MFVEEEQSADSERTHTSEAVGFVVFAGTGPVGGGAATYYVLDGAATLRVFALDGRPRYWNVVLPSGAVVGQRLPGGHWRATSEMRIRD